MKKPRREKGHEPPRAMPEPTPREEPAQIAPWSPWPYLWSGWVGWLEASLRIWQSFLDGERRGIVRFEPSGDVESERRRVSGAPWVPEVTATVIPLRRRTDPPGAEGTRISMRFLVPPLPWNGTGAKVIAVDTLVPRREATDEDAGTQSPDGDEA